MGDALKASNFRYAVLEHSGNDEDGYEQCLVSRHRTKAAAVRSWARAREEAGWLYGDGEWYAIECVFLDDFPGAPGYFRDEDYRICAPEQLGECAVCRHRERPCYGRYADGRCKRTAREEAGPWRVYALADPDDGETRYIGCTEKPLTTRLRQHLSTPGGARGEWIASLRERGTRPLIREVARFATQEEGLRHESHLINTLPGLSNGRRTPSAVITDRQPAPQTAAPNAAELKPAHHDDTNRAGP